MVASLPFEMAKLVRYLQGWPGTRTTDFEASVQLTRKRKPNMFKRTPFFERPGWNVSHVVCKTCVSDVRHLRRSPEIFAKPRTQMKMISVYMYNPSLKCNPLQVTDFKSNFPQLLFIKLTHRPPLSLSKGRVIERSWYCRAILIRFKRRFVWNWPF